MEKESKDTEEKKESGEEVKPKNPGVLEKVRRNPWILSTFVLAILVLAMAVNIIGFPAGKVVSADEAGKNFIDYLNSIAEGEIKLVGVEDSGNLYIVTVEYEGEEIPVYVTKDGSYYTTTLLPIEAPAGPDSNVNVQDVPKSEKPKVELFVMSHCPYGTQAEKGIIPAVEALGNSIDFDIRFVYYAMHPSAGEVQEQLNQYCIQEEQESKYLDYLKCFLKEGKGDVCLTETKIDKTKLSSCVSKIDKQFEIMKNLNDNSLWMSGSYPLFNIHADLNEKYGVGGSPTLVINEKTASSGRSPNDYLQAICGAFSEGSAPSACSTSLSTTTYSPGFGYEASASTGSATCS
jgi:hypothetical protein